MAKEKPFNNPFGALEARAKPAKPQPEPSKPVEKKKQPAVSADDESALFLSAMGAFEPVKPLSEPRPKAVVAAEREQAAADDVESLLELAELVIGDAEMVVERTSGSIVACPKGFDVKLLGALPPASQLALPRDAALKSLERFIVDAQVKRVRCVRVVTGPDLGQLAIEALTRGKLARRVLAFTGTADALDVLLRL